MEYFRVPLSLFFQSILGVKCVMVISIWILRLALKKGLKWIRKCLIAGERCDVRRSYSYARAHEGELRTCKQPCNFVPRGPFCHGNLVPEVAIPGLTKRIAASGNEIVVSFATSWKRLYELGQRYMTLKMKNAHKLIALADNEVIYYVVSVWKVVFWHLVASTHGISVFQSDQIRLDWTTPGQRSQVGWHALRNFLARVLSTLWSTGANNKLCDICFDPLWWKKKLWISQRSKHSWSFNWCVDSKLSKVAVLPEDDIYPKDS